MTTAYELLALTAFLTSCLNLGLILAILQHLRT